MRVRLFQVHYLIRFVGRMHPKWIVNFEFYFVYVKKIGDHHRGQVGYFLFCLFVAMSNDDDRHVCHCLYFFPDNCL